MAAPDPDERETKVHKPDDHVEKRHDDGQGDRFNEANEDDDGKSDSGGDDSEKDG